jgi:hypothetical protein
MTSSSTNFGKLLLEGRVSEQGIWMCETHLYTQPQAWIARDTRGVCVENNTFVCAPDSFAKSA